MKLELDEREVQYLKELDGQNFKAVQILIASMKTEDRFLVWERLSQ